MSAELEALIGFIYASFGRVPPMTLLDGNFFDAMTARGYKLNLVSGYYYR